MVFNIKTKSPKISLYDKFVFLSLSILLLILVLALPGEKAKLLLQLLEVFGVIGATVFASETVRITYKTLLAQKEQESPRVVVFP